MKKSKPKVKEKKKDEENFDYMKSNNVNRLSIKAKYSITEIRMLCKIC